MSTEKVSDVLKRAFPHLLRGTGTNLEKFLCNNAKGGHDGK